jgi:hypothetical protein
MTTIVTRAGKGSALTHNEVDSNFTNLNSAKYESGNNVTLGTISGTTITASTAFSGALNGTVGATTPAAGTFTSLTNSGNLTFTGTGNRILGDFSNATSSNRVAFQTSTTNGQTAVVAIPNGTGNTAQWQAYNSSDSTNASFLGLAIVGTTDARFTSGITGTGTYLPMTFYTGGSERMRIDTSGNVGIGVSSPACALNIATTNFGIELQRYNATPAAMPALELKRSKSGTVGTNSSVSSGDGIGRVSFYGADGANWVLGAQIQAEVDGTPGSFDMPGRIVFSTTADGSSTTTERMRIDSSGNVGIGTSSINSRLVVSGGVGTIARFIGSGGQFQGIGIQNNFGSGSQAADVFYDVANENGAVVANMLGSIQTDGGSSWSWGTQPPGTRADRRQERMRINAAGDLLIGTSTVQARINVQGAGGDVYYGRNSSGSGIFAVNDGGTIFAVSTSISAISDLRLKENIKNIQYGLNEVLNLRPVSYDYIKTSTVVDGSNGYLGFIAQEVETVIPELVGEARAKDENDEPYKSFKMTDMIPVLTKAIQELSAKVDTLQTELNTLKGN